MEALNLPLNFSSGYMRAHVKSGMVEVISTNPKIYRITKHGLAEIGGAVGTATNVPPRDLALIERRPSTPPLVVNGQSALDSAIEALADALVARVSDVVEAKVEGLIAGIVETQVARSLEKLTASIKPATGLGMEAYRTKLAAPPPKAKLPRVLVGGLLPDQANIIQKEFSDALDIRFLGANENVQLWKSNASHADAVFVFADKISHMLIRAVESVGATPIIVKGGMSSLREALTKYYVEV